MEIVLEAESGTSNHPRDLGGPTNMGITQTYNTYRLRAGEPKRLIAFL